MKPLLFVLGCQRSGTTWLANLLDASPHSCLFMEPFAASYGLFPEFPEASVFLEGAPRELENLLRLELPYRLLRHKVFLFRRSLVKPFWFRLDRALAKTVARFAGVGFPELHRRARGFELLNLNRMRSDEPLFAKAPVPSLWCIKELRLAGKIPLLVSAFPDAHFVVVVRHPCATVQSILEAFCRGRLAELQCDMETYLDKLEVQPVARRYRSLIDRCRRGNVAHRLALYWRVTHETLVGDLEDHRSLQVVVFEDLATRPQAVARALWEQIGLEWSPSVDDYLALAAARETVGAAPPGAVEYALARHRSWSDAVSAATRSAVLEITADCSLLPRFEPFYEVVNASPG